VFTPTVDSHGLTMNNHPGHNPLYPLGNPTNIQLLDNMFNLSAAAAEQQANVHRSAIPQYAAYQDMQLQAHSHHAAMNLAQSHVLTEVSAPQVIVYHETPQQQQPISYKIPTQMESAAAAAAAQSAHINHQQMRQHNKIQQHEKKKDIVAEATSKIFEDIGGLAKESSPSNLAAPSAALPITAIKSEPVAGPSSESMDMDMNDSQDIKPGTSGGSGQRGRGRGRGGMVGGFNRQSIQPRLALLEDEDDGLTCRMCLQSFWYKAQLLDHLKSTHSIAEPDRYEREEREKKLRRLREAQQRSIMAKRQRMTRGGRGGRGPGRPAMVSKPAGPRPSFQYRDGAFICDLCKKSFSDGNDMVTHWKSHVKKQRLGSSGSRGRPKGMSLGRADKGKPRWTAYLVWSTRRRKELTKEYPDLTFAGQCEIQLLI
jgi:hypothetical protein